MNHGHPEGRPICHCCGAPALTQAANAMLEALAKAPNGLGYFELQERTELSKRHILRAVNMFDDLFAYRASELRDGHWLRILTLSIAGRAALELRAKAEAAE